MELLKKIASSALRIILSVIVGLVLIMGPYVEYKYTHTNAYKEAHIQQIFQKIRIATGRANEVPPLTIVNQPVINAYATPTGIFIYQGMIDYCQNDDEIAMVLGHEVSHVMLGHLDKLAANSDQEQQVLESMADKMGALYMMRAGYNICTGRAIWNRLTNQYGESMGGDHPDNAYRYEQLDVQCEWVW